MHQHLWYLSEVSVGLELFDPAVDVIEKRLIVVNMNTIASAQSWCQSHRELLSTAAYRGQRNCWSCLTFTLTSWRKSPQPSRKTWSCSLPHRSGSGHWVLSVTRQSAVLHWCRRSWKVGYLKQMTGLVHNPGCGAEPQEVPKDFKVSPQGVARSGSFVGHWTLLKCLKFFCWSELYCWNPVFMCNF